MKYFFNIISLILSTSIFSYSYVLIYIIVENHSGFRNKEVSNLLFEVERPLNNVFRLDQLQWYSSGIKEYKKENGNRKNLYNLYSVDDLIAFRKLYRNIIYQTDNLEDAENQLDMLENMKKYNL